MGESETTPVKVRCRMMMNAQGKWAVYGWTGASDDDCDSVLYDMMGGEETNSARQFWITAEVPLPQSVEIEGKLE